MEGIEGGEGFIARATRDGPAVPRTGDSARNAEICVKTKCQELKVEILRFAQDDKMVRSWLARAAELRDSSKVPQSTVQRGSLSYIMRPRRIGMWSTVACMSHLARVLVLALAAHRQT